MSASFSELSDSREGLSSTVRGALKRYFSSTFILLLTFFPLRPALAWPLEQPAPVEKGPSKAKAKVESRKQRLKSFRLHHPDSIKISGEDEKLISYARARVSIQLEDFDRALVAKVREYVSSFAKQTETGEMKESDRAEIYDLVTDCMALTDDFETRVSMYHFLFKEHLVKCSPAAFALAKVVQPEDPSWKAAFVRDDPDQFAELTVRSLRQKSKWFKYRLTTTIEVFRLLEERQVSQISAINESLSQVNDQKILELIEVELKLKGNPNVPDDDIELLLKRLDKLPRSPKTREIEILAISKLGVSSEERLVNFFDSDLKEKPEENPLLFVRILSLFPARLLTIETWKQTLDLILAEETLFSASPGTEQESMIGRVLVYPFNDPGIKRIEPEVAFDYLVGREFGDKEGPLLSYLASETIEWTLVGPGFQALPRDLYPIVTLINRPSDADKLLESIEGRRLLSKVIQQCTKEELQAMIPLLSASSRATLRKLENLSWWSRALPWMTSIFPKDWALFSHSSWMDLSLALVGIEENLETPHELTGVIQSIKKLHPSSLFFWVVAVTGSWLCWNVISAFRLYKKPENRILPAWNAYAAWSEEKIGFPTDWAQAKILIARLVFFVRFSAFLGVSNLVFQRWVDVTNSRTPRMKPEKRNLPLGSRFRNLAATDLDEAKQSPLSFLLATLFAGGEFYIVGRRRKDILEILTAELATRRVLAVRLNEVQVGDIIEDHNQVLTCLRNEFTKVGNFKEKPPKVAIRELCRRQLVAVLCRCKPEEVERLRNCFRKNDLNAFVIAVTEDQKEVKFQPALELAHLEGEEAKDFARGVFTDEKLRSASENIVADLTNKGEKTVSTELLESLLSVLRESTRGGKKGLPPLATTYQRTILELLKGTSKPVDDSLACCTDLAWRAFKDFELTLFSADVEEETVQSLMDSNVLRPTMNGELYFENPVIVYHLLARFILTKPDQVDWVRPCPADVPDRFIKALVDTMSVIPHKGEDFQNSKRFETWQKLVRTEFEILNTLGRKRVEGESDATVLIHTAPKNPEAPRYLANFCWSAVVGPLRIYDRLLATVFDDRFAPNPELAFLWINRCLLSRELDSAEGFILRGNCFDFWEASHLKSTLKNIDRDVLFLYAATDAVYSCHWQESLKRLICNTWSIAPVSRQEDRIRDLKSGIKVIDIQENANLVLDSSIPTDIVVKATTYRSLASLAAAELSGRIGT